MDLTHEARGPLTIVRLTGDLDATASPAAQQAFDALVDAGRARLALDCLALRFLSSAGLRVLLLLAKRITSVGGRVVLFGLNERVADVFEISGFDTIFRIEATEAEALAAL
jgi:stage II sporulation protein AA (anti-sigma F factor antagonist)